MLICKRVEDRFNVYETSATPWLLVDSFETEEEAKICISYRKPGVLVLYKNPWSEVILQEENARCCICRAALTPGTEVFAKNTQSQFNSTARRNHFEFKCLRHIPTRFERINEE